MGEEGRVRTLIEDGRQLLREYLESSVFDVATDLRGFPQRGCSQLTNTVSME